MIILDLSQVMIASLHAQLGGHNAEVNENLLRHMILNTIRSNYVKFKDKYGELIIACDSTNNWRKVYFPYYKANRKKARDASSLDWNMIFESLGKIRDELKDYFPYRVIHVDTCEADDIIGVICKEYGRDLGGEPILILSGDKDFSQLQKYSNIEQYDPTRKKKIVTSNPINFLYEHIIKGDVGDGVPNFLSADDTFVSSSRQKPVTSKKLNEWISKLNKTSVLSEVFESEELRRNFIRNQLMIDLEKIPDFLSVKILQQFEEQANKPRGNLFNYFIKHKLKHLTESIQEF